jgi:hypothetical protein
MSQNYAHIHEADSRVEALAPGSGSRPTCGVDPGFMFPVTRDGLPLAGAASAFEGGVVGAPVGSKERVA